MTPRVVATRQPTQISLEKWSKAMAAAKRPTALKAPGPAIVKKAPVAPAKRPAAQKKAAALAHPMMVKKAPVAPAKRPAAQKKIVRVTQAVTKQPFVIKNGKRVFVAPQKKKTAKTPVSTIAKIAQVIAEKSAVSTSVPASSAFSTIRDISNPASNDMDFTKAIPGEATEENLDVKPPMNKKLLIGAGIIGIIAIIAMKRKR